MCNKIDPNLVERAIGSFDKRGDGQVQHFPILVTICECESTYWARTPNGVIWVEAEKDGPAPDLDSAHQFAQEASNVRV